MAEFFKTIKKGSARQLKFFLLVIILAAVVVGFSIYTVIFLLSNLDNALSADEVIKMEPPKFELERFEALNLRK